MMTAMRARLLMALGLSCAIAPATACKKTDGDVSGVGNETTRKRPPPVTSSEPPPPPVKTKKAFVPDRAKYPTSTGSCPVGTFCTNEPDGTDPSDSDPLYLQCGGSSKVPAGLATDKTLEGISANLAPDLTELVRKDEPDSCCFVYPAGPCGKGRPLRHQGAPVLADEIARDDWSGSPLDLGVVAEDVRASATSDDVDAFVAHLRGVALLEHASVAAFARVSLELLALGAPSELVAAAHVAAMDEIRHAQVCWGLLAALEGAARGPAAHDLPPFASVDVDDVLVTTVIDGCVGETLASLLLRESARRCSVPSLAAIYDRIADDEERHATLAFRIVRFLAARDPGVAATALSLARGVALPPSPGHACEPLGLLSESAQHSVHLRGLREVVLPLLHELA